MAATNVLQVANPGVSSRAPLALKLNSPSQSPGKILCRKSSFIRKADSSEDPPSPHGSIYEASYFSNTNSDDGSHSDTWPKGSLGDFNLPVTVGFRENDENSRISRNQQLDDSQFIYGRGTVLNSIPESRSHSTLRTLARAKSMDDMKIIPLAAHDDSFSVGKSPRRKQSFSDADLARINSSYHKAITMIERTSRALVVPEVYAEPRSPIQKPPERPPTPPGMPSWTDHQNMSSAVRTATALRTQNRFQRLFGLSALPGIPFASRATSVNSGTRARSASAPIRMARFRPPRSVYSTMEQHPFNRAPVARLVQPPVLQSAAVPLERPRFSTFGSPIFQKLAGKRKSSQKVRFTSSTQTQGPLLRTPQTPSCYPIAAESSSAILPTTPPRSIVPVRISTSPNVLRPKQKQCPHRKSRRKLLKPLHWAIPARPLSSQGDPPATGQNFLTSPPRFYYHREDMFGSPNSALEIQSTRTLSVSSSTNLMPSGPGEESAVSSPTQNYISASPLSPAPHFQRDPSVRRKCWRCMWKNFANSYLEAQQSCNDEVFGLLKESRNFFCFVCCGYDADQESRPGSGHGWNGTYVNAGFRPTRSSTIHRSLGSRHREALEATPIVL